MSNSNPKKRRRKHNWKRTVAIVLATVLALMLVVPYILEIAYAASSDEILAELEELQNQSAELSEDQAELQTEIQSAQTETMSYVEQKAAVDQMLQVTQSRIDNMNEQITEYNLLISARQAELDEAESEEAAMYEKYQDRIRAMEEYGDVSYWSVLFQASSLSDVIDRMEMVGEIAKADQEMLEELKAVSSQIEEAKAQLEEAKAQLEASKAELDEQEAALAEQQAQSDALILTMTSDVSAMEEVSDYYQQQEEELSDEIADTLKAYYAAVAQEEALAAAQAAAQAASNAADDAESAADAAEEYVTETQSYVDEAKLATTSDTAQKAWDNAAWCAYLAQEKVDRAQEMVTAIESETKEAQRQALTNPDAEPYATEAASYTERAQAAVDRAQAAADEAEEIAARAEAYVTALEESETTDSVVYESDSDAQSSGSDETSSQATEEDSSSTYSASYIDVYSGFLFPLPAGTSYVSSAYGYREHPIYGYYTFHNGVDLAADSGTEVYATKSGTVVAASYGSANGNYVTISHSGGVSSCYLHLSSYCVSAGDYVEQGQVIGYVGSTGSSTGPHLHFSILIDGEYVNPMEYVSVT